MKEILVNEWAYSFDGERYFGEYDNKEDAIEEAKADYSDKEQVYVGQCVKHEFTENDCDTYGDSILEFMDETLGDVCGEWSETWLESISEEQEKKLNKLLAKTIIEWVNKNNLHPSCYTIQNEELIILNEGEQ